MRVTPVDQNTRIRSEHNTSGIIVDYAQPNDIVEGEELFTAPVDFTFNGTVIQFKSDKWLRVTFVNGLPASGWIAITNKGLAICIELPYTGEITLTHTIEVYSDGSLKIDGNSYP